MLSMASTAREVLRMADANKSPQKGSDWTRLLTDPDLISHLGLLLQTYREVSPEKRESALLQVMRGIKEQALHNREKVEKQASTTPPVPTAPPPEPAILPAPEPVSVTPPFEPDLFTPAPGSDRRHYPRIKCYIAVEIRVEGVDGPIWGNLSNVGRGGCMVETASAVPAGKALQIGLWVANGKVWVKGVVISGIATRSAPSFGVRVKFSEAELSEKEHLRSFLKFVDSNTRKAHSENTYMAKLKQ